MLNGLGLMDGTLTSMSIATVEVLRTAPHCLRVTVSWYSTSPPGSQQNA